MYSPLHGNRLNLKKNIYNCLIPVRRVRKGSLISQMNSDHLNYKFQCHFKGFKTTHLFSKYYRIICDIYWGQTGDRDQIEPACKQKVAPRTSNQFSPDLFNLHSKAILTELDFLPGFIIDKNNLNTRKKADDSVLMADAEKLQEIREQVVKEN